MINLQGLTDRPGPNSWPRFLNVMLGTGLVLLTMLLMRELAVVVAPVLMAVNLLIAAYPIHARLRAKRLPGWLSATIMLLTVSVILLAMVAGLVWAASAMITELPKYSGQWVELYNQVIGLLSRYGIDTTGMSNIMQQINPNSVVSALSSVLTSATALATVLGAIFVTVVFLGMDTPDMQRRLQLAADDYPRLATSMGGFATNVRRYWVWTTVFGLVLGVLDGVALTIMHVPLAPVWALLAFLTNYIPSIGFVIGLVPPALFALLDGGPQLALTVAAIYAVVSVVVLMLIQPRVVGESVGVTPTVGFTSLLLWSFVLGPLGALMALPTTLLLKAIFVDGDPTAAWLDALMSIDTSPKGGAK